MDDIMLRIVACLVTTGLFCISTEKLLGAMQQSNYKNKTFWRWLRRKDNLYCNRLVLLVLCLLLSSSVTALCFSFLGNFKQSIIKLLQCSNFRVPLADHTGITDQPSAEHYRIQFRKSGL